MSRLARVVLASVALGTLLPADARAAELSAPELIDELHEAFDSRFRQYQTRRWIVVSDAKASWVRERSGVLERAWHQFFRFARRTGLEVTEPKQPLVAVIFADNADYTIYAEETDGVSAPWVGGYYTSLGNRIMLFDDRSSPWYIQAQQEMEEARESLRDAERDRLAAARRGDRNSARAIASAADEFASSLNLHGRELEEHIERSAVARTVHEAVHQLAFNSGLQRRDRRWPFWLSEGLASSFETDEPNAGFGPHDGYAPRDEAFLRLAEEDRLMDWGALVAMASAPRSADDAARAYAQSYGLFRYLARKEKPKLVGFFEDLNSRVYSSRELHEAFEQRFGDASDVGRAAVRLARSQRR